ncbi:hypothetical protein [Candidatus Nitrospira bockiana]
MNRQLAMIMDLQARLSERTCPGCGHDKLELVLRCDAHAEHCTFVVRCAGCGMRMLVDLDTVAPTGPQDGAPAGVSEVRCPRCGSADCQVKFRCDASTQRCAYEVECRTCHQMGRDAAPRRSVA